MPNNNSANVMSQILQKIILPCITRDWEEYFNSPEYKAQEEKYKAEEERLAKLPWYNKEKLAIKFNEIREFTRNKIYNIRYSLSNFILERHDD